MTEIISRIYPPDDIAEKLSGVAETKGVTMQTLLSIYRQLLTKPWSYPGLCEAYGEDATRTYMEALSNGRSYENLEKEIEANNNGNKESKANNGNNDIYIPSSAGSGGLIKINQSNQD